MLNAAEGRRAGATGHALAGCGRERGEMRKRAKNAGAKERGPVIPVKSGPRRPGSSLFRPSAGGPAAAR